MTDRGGTELDIDLRIRLPLPLVIPLAIACVIGGLVAGFAHILLTVPPGVAAVIAAITAINIVAAFALIATRPDLGGRRAVELVLVAFYPVIAGIVISVTGLSAPSAERAAAAAGGGAPANTLTHVTVTAKNVAFDTKKITVAADKQVTIHFVNQDPSSVQHNIAVYDSPKAAKTIYKGKVIPGGSDIDYTFKTPKPGTYFFRCDIHPTSMTGTFVVK